MASEPNPDIPQTMRAWTHVRAGKPNDVLSLSAIPVPALPSPTSVLVRVSHAALHPGATILMHLAPFLFRKSPAVADTDFSGVVVAVGTDIPIAPSTEAEDGGSDDGRWFPVGTPVFGTVPVGAHLGSGQGALAEYVAVEVGMIARKPDGTTFGEAAGLAVSGATAVDVVDAAKLRPGARCLVNAAGGGVGHMAVQLARDAVGSKGYVLGVCSEGNAATAKELGCDETVDYRASTPEGSLVQRLAGSHPADSERAFDAVIDTHGSQELWHASLKFLRPGTDHPYATVGPKFSAYTFGGVLGTVVKMIANSATPTWLGGVPRVYNQVASFVDTARLERIRRLADQGKLRVVVGDTWDMDDALKAYEKMLSGHGTGKIVVKIWDPTEEGRE